MRWWVFICLQALLASKLYWACPFVPFIWKRMGPIKGRALRIGFEASYTINTCVQAPISLPSLSCTSAAALEHHVGVWGWMWQCVRMYLSAVVSKFMTSSLTGRITRLLTLPMCSFLPAGSHASSPFLCALTYLASTSLAFRWTDSCTFIQSHRLKTWCCHGWGVLRRGPRK